ncbi:3-dehydroquinate dehydratase / shikimate dehydrogenase [Phycisphaerales bacterium]|nr:3-dehydroquinate dehydratase / shikimate dehydrogenase [Phycisphaerales bacterium]
MTLLCVPILVRDVAATLRDAVAARDAGADIVEFRVDEAFAGTGAEGESREIERMVKESPLPAIVTCRAASEGGHYDGDDDVRVAMYEHLGTGDGPPRYLDLELATYERSANLRQKVHLAIDWPARRRADAPSLILSLHEFRTRPADLSRRVGRMAAAESASVVKVAYRARSVRDNLELLDLIGQTGRPTIALGMGEFGLMSRVLAPKFGGFLTFASLRDSSATAPGQPTIAELLDIYRFRAIRRSTRVYGVIGWPVSHSMSPRVHNAGFDATRHDGVYVPIPIAVGDDEAANYAAFKGTVLELIDHAGLGFSGASVTLPHKENLTRLAKESGWDMDEASAATGAANTIVVNRERGEVGVRVLNTDVSALVSCIEAEGKLRGSRVAVLGAGGVARGAAWGLARAGGQVVLFNRDRTRAERSAAAVGLGVGVGEWGGLSSGKFDVFVNCTPVGMKDGPAPGQSLIGDDVFRCSGPATVVMDTVYNPARTLLLEAASRAGLRTVSGVEMFVRQAAAQFEAWTGREAPVDVFRSVCEAGIGA